MGRGMGWVEVILDRENSEEEEQEVGHARAPEGFSHSQQENPEDEKGENQETPSVRKVEKVEMA